MTKDQFARLVLDSTNSLYRISKGILKNESDCEDAVSETILIGFSKLDMLQHDEYAKTWLVRILIHECFKILRMRKRQTYEVQEMASATLEKHYELYEAISKIDEKYRIPIILFYIEGYSVREISEILESTEGTVKSWLSRGRMKLKKLLEEDGI